MTELMEFLNGFDIRTILSLGAFIWILYRATIGEFHEISKEIREIHTEIRKMNTRLSRVEGTLYGKDVYTQVKED